MLNKKMFAINFINRVRTSNPQDLDKLVAMEVGEELSNFFLEYATTLTTNAPNQPIQNATSLMLMGYLIRAKEDQQIPNFQGYQLLPGQFLQ